MRDVNVFGPLKNALKDVNFLSGTEVQYAVCNWLHQQNMELYNKGTHHLAVFQIPLVISMKMTVFWDVVTCSLVENDRHALIMDAVAPLKHRKISIRLHGATTRRQSSSSITSCLNGMHVSVPTVTLCDWPK
jgi:hypothetical protein